MILLFMVSVILLILLLLTMNAEDNFFTEIVKCEVCLFFGGMIFSLSNWTSVTFSDQYIIKV